MLDTLDVEVWRKHGRTEGGEGAHLSPRTMSWSDQFFHRDSPGFFCSLVWTSVSLSLVQKELHIAHITQEDSNHGT